jgi:hypothetical protein
MNQGLSPRKQKVMFNLQSTARTRLILMGPESQVS